MVAGITWLNFLLVPADLSESNYCNRSPLQSLEADKERLAKPEVGFAVGADRGFGNHHDDVGDHGDGDGDTKRTPLAAP